MPLVSSQVCGTAQYVDDIKLPPGSLHCALVLSTRPHARILGIDAAAAAAMPGVHGIYTGGQCVGREGRRCGVGVGGRLAWQLPAPAGLNLCSLLLLPPIPSLLPPPIPVPVGSQGRPWRQRHRPSHSRRAAVCHGKGQQKTKQKRLAPVASNLQLCSLGPAEGGLRRPRTPPAPPICPHPPHPSALTRPSCMPQELVTCVGQPLGIVAADTEEQARAAAAAVVVEYEDLPAVLDIEAAIAGGLARVLEFGLICRSRV